MTEKPLSTEYPKSLYMGGDRNAEHKVVGSDDQERAARKDGFKMIDKAHDAAAVERLTVVEEKPAEPQAVVKKAKK